MDMVVALMQRLEAKVSENSEAQLQAETKNRLRMGDRQREFEAIKRDYMDSVQAANENAESEFRQQMDLALLRMTEKKVQAERKVKDL